MPGPAPHPRRDGDKIQARQLIAYEVRTGRRPPASALACVDCGHVCAPGSRRHEYDHHLGYAAEHHGSVQPVCSMCHHSRDNAKKRATHCVRGHEFNEANTIRKPNGTRKCRECFRAYDRRRRDASYWRNYREKRNG